MAQKYTGKTVEFVCQPKRVIFCNEKSGFRIYSVTVDQTEYPDIVIHPTYRTATISGDKIFELDLNNLYLVKANETNGQYGIGYEVISIQVKPLETHQDKLNFLSKVLTPLQASTLLSHYPDIIEQIRTNPKFEPDYKLLKGITPKRFERIQMKINENYEYADICSVFYDSMTMNVIKKLKKKYETVDAIKRRFDVDPYDTLCEIEGIGFKKADAICLAIEDGANKMRANKQEPTYEFPSPITNSVQRCKACMLYCMEELENAEGSTRINLEDLKGKVASLIGACVQHFSESLNDKKYFHLDDELETVSLVSTYRKELYITIKLNEGLKSNIDWKYEGDLVTSVNGQTLTDEQIQTQKEILENNIVLLTGSAGCVDADTEFFDGTQWKKISEYKPGDKVMECDIHQQKCVIRSPLKYIKRPCNHFWHFWSEHFDEYLSDDHIINYDPINQKSCLSLLTEIFGGNLPVEPQKLHSIKQPFYCDFKYVLVNGQMVKEPYENIWVEKVEASNPHKYCFSTTSGYFLTRRNGKITITHNCGKSFSMKAMIEMLDNANKSYILLSPTAKAAKVLSSATERNASTIHRGLGVMPFGNSYKFIHDAGNPFTFDVVIVDEFSMVDTDLFYNLLSAIDFTRTKLLLIFDPAQLASVGPGNISYDMVMSGLFKTVSLNRIFRYSEGGLITVATDTRNCKRFLPATARYETTRFGKSFVFVPEDNECVVDCAVELYATLLNKGNTFDDTILLSAQNKGPQGTVCINEKIQNQINPQPEDQRITFENGDLKVEYRLDDIVIQTVNDYNSIVCDENGHYEEDENGEPENKMLIANGETGRITKIDKSFAVIKYGDYYIYRDKIQLLKTQLGYAISCHRSQGSGYKNVIIVAPSSHSWQLNSNLLYVGFTRAKEHCWCLGDADAVNRAVGKKMEIKRKTNLSILFKRLRSESDE